MLPWNQLSWIKHTSRSDIGKELSLILNKLITPKTDQGKTLWLNIYALECKYVLPLPQEKNWKAAKSNGYFVERVIVTKWILLIGLSHIGNPWNR